jgi:MurNAc alpha-1-phosphate uridylyltransferase
MQKPALMIFAAGFGTRMGAVTKTTPKPLIHVAGRALIDHALAVARAAGITKIVVNLHHLGHQIEAHLASQDITLVWERGEILETGGGLKAAMPHLGAGPVLLLNSDAVWTGDNPLSQLLEKWDAQRMDALLLMAPREHALGHAGTGDFLLADDGRITAWAKGAAAPIYLGAQIVNPNAVRDWPERVFSMTKIWDQYITTGRAYGTLHRGGWCDVGTMEGVAVAERLLNV